MTGRNIPEGRKFVFVSRHRGATPHDRVWPVGEWGVATALCAHQQRRAAPLRLQPAGPPVVLPARPA
jgi:hypothetical protein